MKSFKTLSILLLLFVSISCSKNDDSNNVNKTDESLLMERWFSESIEDQDGDTTDVSTLCLFIEFTEELYIATDFTGENCSIEFSSGSLPYSRINDLIYFGEVSQDIKIKITALTETTLKLRQDYSDDQGTQFYDIVTYSRVD
jgi:hypothetical protein